MIFFWNKKKYQLLVPYFGICYRRINPGEGKKFVILRNGKRIRGDFQVENIVSMLLLKWFWDYNGTMGKLKNYELFMVCGQALDKSSHYHELWGSNFGNERLPTIYENYIKEKDKEYLDNISFKKYTQYITKAFFIDRLLKIFSNIETALMRHRDDDDNFDEYLEFFIIGTINFFKSLRLKASFLDKLDSLKEIDKNFYRNKSAFSVIMETLNELLVWEDAREPSGKYPEVYEFFGEHPNVKVAWKYLYDQDPEKINGKMLGVEDNSLSYSIIDV